MSAQTKLNPRQLQAIKHLGTPLLVLAGAGSGKTRVITHKIAYLIGQLGLSPRSIVAVTFTNKAAREMKERITRLLQGKPSKGLIVSTFHSLGLSLLRSEYARLGYRKGFSILDTQDTETLLKELNRQASLSVDLADLRWQISHWKGTLQSPDEVLASARNDTEAAHARLYERYQRQLLAYNAVDFDDLIMQPVHLLQRISEVKSSWQDRIRHLLIDEYQDTNAGQYSLMKLLVGTHDGLTVVGDDDQSIYSWRGARPENIAQLTHDFPALEVIKLEQNYRSNNRILQSANRLIANNSHLFDKRLWSEQGLGEQLRIIPCKDPQDEAQHIAREITSKQFKQRDEYSDYAVLYRSNHQARPLEQALREHNIPYTISGGLSFFERVEIKDVIAYLRLVANPDDDPAFLRIVNTPRREIGPTTLEKLGEYAHQRQISLFRASQELGFAQRLSSSASLRLARFTDWVQDMAKQATLMEPVKIAQRLIEDIAYFDWLKSTSKNRNTAEKREEHVHELLDWIFRLRAASGEASDLDTILGHMMLLDIIDRQSDDKPHNAVHLMTLHAAKGLEFPHLWIAGMEENTLPHHNNLEGEQLEEERRLFYVGMTRAQTSLNFTYAANRNRYGEQVNCEPSRFLGELPKEHVLCQASTANLSAPQTRQTGKTHLSQLKALLEG
jgi:ATP-dependent DNA helicase Rep